MDGWKSRKQKGKRGMRDKRGKKQRQRKWKHQEKGVTWTNRSNMRKTDQTVRWQRHILLIWLLKRHVKRESSEGDPGVRQRGRRQTDDMESWDGLEAVPFSLLWLPGKSIAWLFLRLHLHSSFSLSFTSFHLRKKQHSWMLANCSRRRTPLPAHSCCFHHKAVAQNSLFESLYICSLILEKEMYAYLLNPLHDKPRNSGEKISFSTQNFFCPVLYNLPFFLVFYFSSNSWPGQRSDSVDLLMSSKFRLHGPGLWEPNTQSL